MTLGQPSPSKHPPAFAFASAQETARLPTEGPVLVLLEFAEAAVSLQSPLSHPSQPWATSPQK